jgi:y4mF family transcriptional regulator
MEMIQNTKQLGQIIRRIRKDQKLTQKDLAAVSGVGERFIRELERGKETCQIEKSFHVLKMLGMQIKICYGKI